MAAGRASWARRLTATGLVLVVAATVGLLVYFRWFQPQIASGRVQPISFSHRLHVTDKQIDCYYCHPYPGRSLNSGLPSVQKCLGCHRYIIPDHPQIARLRGYEQRRQDLPWVRVYYCPDHVFFPHYRHIRRGIACDECHGPVAQMDRLQTRTFYMGFCLDCHHRTGASRECTGCHQ